MNPLDLARRLIAAGIPVVVVKPGDRPPRGWQTARANVNALKGFRPGEDALAMVSGCGADAVDLDTKVHGALANLPTFRYYGVTTTPSGGNHYIVASTLIGKISPLRTNLGPVGDYAGGRLDGTGRMLIFLPGSVRTKYPNGGYVETETWDIEGCINAEPDEALEGALLDAGGGYGEASKYVDTSPVREEESVHPYAQRAVDGELERLEACDSLGWGGAPWDSTTYAVACNLIEIANSNWSGYSLDQAHTDLMRCAPMDPGFGEKEHESKWSSALNKVDGGGRISPDAPELTALHEIFDASPLLDHIRTAAHSRLIGSGALLCYVLGRVLAEVPATVVLPPIIGSPASLNLAFALVGKSGDGKSTTSRASAELLDVNQDDIETGVGSGEGLMEAYLETVTIPDPNDPKNKIKIKQLIQPPTRILEIEEIGQLGAVAHRDGSSMMSVLRAALTGGALKSANASVDRRRNVNRGTYRLVSFVGVQPELSGILLNDVGAGTPQRFVWVSVVDRTLPDDIPEWPGPLEWNLPTLGNYVVGYPEHVKQEVIDTRKRQVKEGLDPLRGHQLLTQLKVAAALAFLHGERDITDRWWAVAAKVMRWSAKEQTRCAAVLAEVGNRASVAKGREVVEVESIVEDSRAQRAYDNMVRKLSKVKECWWVELEHSIRFNHRAYAEEALDSLVDQGRVKVTDGESKGRPTRKIRWIG